MKLLSIKIQNGEGLFSSGGIIPHFTKRGKTWSMLGHVSTHLGQMRNVPDDWTIIIAEISEDGMGVETSSIKRINAKEHWEGVLERRKESKNKFLLERQKIVAEREQKEFERLNKIYGNP